MANETEEDLRAAMQRFAKAWFESDRQALNALLSETYSHNGGNGGRSNREGFLRIVENFRGRLAGLAFRDVQVRIIHGVGIVTGMSFMRMKATGPNEQGGARLTFTQVWLMRDDEWQIEAFQATPSPDSGSQRIEISQVGA
jgi:hypothetical protein